MLLWGHCVPEEKKTPKPLESETGVEILVLMPMTAILRLSTSPSLSFSTCNPGAIPVPVLLGGSAVAPTQRVGLTGALGMAGVTFSR